MLNKLSFNIFNELNESETKEYKIKKRVIVESTGIKTINENLSAKITFECNECGHVWDETFEDYFTDEDDLYEVLETGEMDCPNCGGNDVYYTDYDILNENKSVCEKCGKEPCECKTLNEDNNKIPTYNDYNNAFSSEFKNKFDTSTYEDGMGDLDIFQNGKYIGNIYRNDDNKYEISLKKYLKDKKIVDTWQEAVKLLNNIASQKYTFESSLNEDYSDKLGGDPVDFVSDVQTILDTLNQIDTSSFGTKLAQQMVEDWIETCERQIQKGKRLASGDEFYSEGCSKQKINEDEYGDNPIETNDKYELYKSMKGIDIDGITYGSYLVRDNNGNGVMSFIAKNDIEASKKFNESSMNEDSIEDAKNDSIKKGLYSESSTSLRERFKKFLDNNVKNKDYNFDAYIDDLTTQYGNTGTLEYELSKSESKSGKPELFNYSKEDLKELGYNLDETEENTEIDWDKPRYGDDILDNMWTAVCSNDLNYVKNAFNKDMIKPNTRYQTGTGKHSLIMGALRNNNFEMVDLLKSFGEKIQKSELEEYKNIMSSREYEDDLTKSSIDEAEEMKVKNLQVIKEQGNVYMLEDENKKMIVGENYNADEGIIENAEIYENKDEADKDYLNRCEILKGNEDYKDDLKEAKTVKEYRIIDTTDNKVLKTFKTEDKEKGYTEMRKMSKKLKDEGKKDNLIYKEYKVKK